MFRVTSARREGSSRTAAPCPQTPTPVARLFIRLALALMLALGLGTPAAAVTLVSNIISSSETGTFDSQVAQGFVTGDNANGYTLTRITMEYNTGEVGGDVPTGLDADLYSKHATNDEPGSKLYDLTLSNTISDNQDTAEAVFTAPSGTTITLTTGTTYFIVITTTNTPVAQAVTSGTVGREEEALSGWSIHDTRHVYDSANSQWITRRSDNLNPYQIKVEGEVIASTNTAATGAPAITGDAVVGRTLTAGVGTIADADGLPATTFPDGYSFQWVRQDDMAGAGATDIGGATEQTYTLVAADLGKHISVRVSFTDGGGTAEALTSAAVGPVTDVPLVSTLEESRKEEATVLLRRHVDRFASVSSGAALGRLQGLAPPTTVNAQISARSHKLDAGWTGDGADGGGWAGWSRLFYGWVEGPGDGAVYDLYLGVDWRAPDGRYVIGGLLGHEGADLRLDDGGRFRSRITQVGLYGATYLSDALILDGALAYGFGRPELSQGGVTAEYDTRRLTLRADLTGGLNWRDGSMVIEPQVGVLHVQEELGAFTDSDNMQVAAETLRLTRLGIGPRLTWALPGGTFTGRARVNWDRHNLDGDGDKVSDLSASLDARLRYALEGGLSAEFFGAADGIGLSGDQQTYTAGVSLNFRF